MEDWHTNDIISVTGWESTFSDSISGMLEGELTNPGVSNKMELNTGSGSSDWIDTSLYRNLTFAAKAERVLDVEVHWVDEHSVEHHFDSGVDIETAWTETGPVNLQDINPDWDDEKATAFWLEFSHPTSEATTDVRIGWIKLTE